VKVSLSHSFRPVKAPGTATPGAPLLDPAGPRIVLGWDGAELAAPLAPSARTLFGPRGVCLHPDGSFWIADTGHHRLLGWRTAPGADNAAADILIGQPDFSCEGRNARAAAGAASMNVPTGVCAWGDGLALADPWNHRVLLWRRTPRRDNQPADIVLGQADFTSNLANRGTDRPTAATLHWPYGVASAGGRLLVCDTGNRRVLVWDDPAEAGQPADNVLGQADFATRDENAGGAVSAASMRWPHGVALWGDRLAVTDAGNNRVMLWPGMPAGDGAAAELMLGQASMETCDHNMAAYYPTDRALNMPYAIAAANGSLVVADTANSRLLGWSGATAAAERLTGQPDFAAKGDNRWGLPARDSLCWPYGLSALGNTIAIADSGNNRVLIWDLADAG
jgi:sugar lactone lactonase YvrE